MTALDGLGPQEKRALLGELLAELVRDAVAEVLGDLTSSTPEPASDDDIVPSVMSAEDAARHVGLGINRMRLLLAEGRIPARRVGTGPRARWLVRRDALDAYVTEEEQRQAGNGDAPGATGAS